MNFQHVLYKSGSIAHKIYCVYMSMSTAMSVADKAKVERKSFRRVFAGRYLSSRQYK